MSAIRIVDLRREREHLFRRINVQRDRINLTRDFSDLELIQRYRFDNNSIIYLSNLLECDLEPRTGRNHAVSVEIQLLTALRYFASGSMQRVLGDTQGLSQPTVSQIVRRVAESLAAKAGDFISMPQHARLDQLKTKFHASAGFPGVIGLIDGTHIRIQAPTAFEMQFVNRKNFHSINVQVVVDPSDPFTNIVACWPGGTHDSHILRNSSVWELFEGRGYPDGAYLLGDSGYPCRPWLLTPFMNPQTRAEQRFNRLDMLRTPPRHI
jgi:hypothetical protein